MTASEIIKEIIKQQNLSQAKLGHRIGLTAGTIGDRLASNTSVNNLIQMLSAMDYELVVIPKSGAKKPEGSFLVERGSK